jgi:hypothetical protein
MLLTTTPHVKFQIEAAETRPRCKVDLSRTGASSRPSSVEGMYAQESNLRDAASEMPLKELSGEPLALFGEHDAASGALLVW